MKKIILAAAALLMCSASAFAQNSFDWGVKAGLNLATVTKSDGDMKPSIYAGVFAEFLLVEDYLTLQPELIYSRQGVKDGDMKMRLNYFNIPVMFKLWLVDGLTLDLGPQFGIMLNSKMRWKEDGKTHTETIDGLKNFDVSVGMGLSYRFIESMDVTARYNLGLTKLNDVDGSKAKNGVIQVGVGYRF